MEPQSSSIEPVEVSSFALAAGSDLVARRPTVALFAPAGSSVALLRPFLDAPDDSAAIEAVRAGATAASSTDVSASANVSASFVLVGWAPPRVIVCGDLEVRLEAVSGSGSGIVSGRGSTVWVAHDLTVGNRLRVSVNGDHADPATELSGGSVRAAGFMVTLSGAQQGSGSIAAPVTAPTSRTEPAPASIDAMAPGPSEAPAPIIELGTSGLRLTLDQPVLIGRGPDSDAIPGGSELVPVALDDAKISRNHLIVAWAAGALLVTDCDSTNGTIVVEEPGARPVALAPNEPVRLSEDAVVYLGDETIRRR